ncbi:unnamed protein product [Bursaphelenchus xylophilus]|uniref:(pine wood nematode) hypothetical protein n=1 Tax=Bursaphelenchus xylophilus TaxID=6326 RepID=A0A1I7RVQ4_BURXY|nr:unnamed protein product [Bursaphelenchus xylophilus]CAG9082005.1 unnamed protein product [Bursaphelenchus xylophilus]
MPCRVGFSTTFVETLIQELLTMVKIELTACAECGFQTTESDELWVHVQMHESGLFDLLESCRDNAVPVPENGAPKAAEFVCETCGKSMTSRGNLERHKRRHNQALSSKEYECPMCQKKFIRKDQRRDHVQRHMRNARDIYCPICPEKFENYEAVLSHIEVHGKVHECRLCHTNSYVKTPSLIAHFYAEHYDTIDNVKKRVPESVEEPSSEEEKQEKADVESSQTTEPQEPDASVSKLLAEIFPKGD